MGDKCHLQWVRWVENLAMNIEIMAKVIKKPFSPEISSQSALNAEPDPITRKERLIIYNTRTFYLSSCSK